MNGNVKAAISVKIHQESDVKTHTHASGNLSGAGAGSYRPDLQISGEGRFSSKALTRAVGRNATGNFWFKLSQM
jgi:hypothetical protein